MAVERHTHRLMRSPRGGIRQVTIAEKVAADKPTVTRRSRKEGPTLAQCCANVCAQRVWGQRRSKSAKITSEDGINRHRSRQREGRVCERVFHTASNVRRPVALGSLYEVGMGREWHRLREKGATGKCCQPVGEGKVEGRVWGRWCR